MAENSSKSDASASLTETSSTASNWRSAMILMRIPFSIFLMPVFWFALSNSEKCDGWQAFWVFLIIHVFLYPASNGYNSYFDKDEGSIGGVERPPEVTSELLFLVYAFDLIAILGAWFVEPLLAAMVLVYTIVSKAYSYDKIRLKRFPILSTVVVTVFQGAFTYLMVLVGVGETIDNLHIGYAVVATMLISGSYPLTQIYQHEEDKERGDITLSLKLGIRGTFLFSAFMFAIGFAGMMTGYFYESRFIHMGIILLSTIPIAIYFGRWLWLSWADEDHVNFQNTMNMNSISSISLSIAFILMILFG